MMIQKDSNIQLVQVRRVSAEEATALNRWRQLLSLLYFAIIGGPSPGWAGWQQEGFGDS
jgi:hypothetical protein